MLLAGVSAALAGCGSKETKEALQKASSLQDQKQYTDANSVLIEALQARESKIHSSYGTPTNHQEADALTKRVQGDAEILRMERAQIPIYLNLERADLASAVYKDILAGNPGDPIIYNQLQNKDTKIRIGAIRVLGLIGKADAIDTLVSAAKDPDQDVRHAAVAALGSIKDPRIVPDLIAALKDSYWFVRSEAADALGQQKDLSAIKPLLDTVADSDSTVESAAENALLTLCTVPHAPADEFAARLNDPNPKLATIAAVCLVSLRDTRAMPVLLKMAADANPKTRLHAVKALGNMSDASAIPPLRQTLKDSDLDVRGWSIIGLGKLKDTASLPDLNAIAADTKEPADIRNAATASVQHITGQTSTSPAPR